MYDNNNPLNEDNLPELEDDSFSYIEAFFAIGEGVDEDVSMTIDTFGELYFEDNWDE